MRPEQYRSVERTITYFKETKASEPNRFPKFLWNAKCVLAKPLHLSACKEDEFLACSCSYIRTCR